MIKNIKLFETAKIREVEFRGKHYKRVVDALKKYLDITKKSGEFTEADGIEMENLFYNLLYEMSKSLGYDFDESDIKRNAYYPAGLAEYERNARLSYKVQNEVFKNILPNKNVSKTDE
jgi:hypothetical protein